MDLTNLIAEKNILVNMQARDKQAVFEELVGLLAAQGIVTDPREMVKHLLERESLGSTSIGRGIAFPHSRAPVVKEPAVALGISQTGIEYGSMDGQPVFVFFLLVAPENAAAEQMKNMSLISGFMRETDCARKIKAASNPGEVMNVLRTKILS